MRQRQPLAPTSLPMLCAIVRKRSWFCIRDFKGDLQAGGGKCFSYNWLLFTYTNRIYGPNGNVGGGGGCGCGGRPHVPGSVISLWCQYVLRQTRAIHLKLLQDCNKKRWFLYLKKEKNRGQWGHFSLFSRLSPLQHVDLSMDILGEKKRNQIQTWPLAPKKSRHDGWCRPLVVVVFFSAGFLFLVFFLFFLQFLKHFKVHLFSHPSANTWLRLSSLKKRNLNYLFV